MHRRIMSPAMARKALPPMMQSILSKKVRRMPTKSTSTPFWLAAPALKELVTGKVAGRQSAEEATCFLNNIGIGLQFAAVGAAVFAEAKSRGIGHEIPTDWFL